MTRRVTERRTGADLSVDAVKTLIKPDTIVGMQQFAAHVGVDERVLDYAVAIVRASRDTPGLASGAGPRGSIALIRAGRARALMQGRGYATPDDVKAVALPALRHRVAPAAEAEIEGLSVDALLTSLLDKVPAPRA
jgi:MoxR-like ATPase